jgi:hypothetical protein
VNVISGWQKKRRNVRILRFPKKKQSEKKTANVIEVWLLLLDSLSLAKE